MNQDTRAIPAAIGAAFEGGFYAGQINSDGVTYALIMAGAAGELSGRWHADNAAVEGAGSTHDGLTNTQAMAAAGSKLAQRALALNIDGFNDWYIPSQDELELLYRNFKPSKEKNWANHGENVSSVPPGADYTRDLPTQTTVPHLVEDEPDALIPAWYWSSTQHADDSDYAWGQYFYYGYQNDNHKSFAGRARAVRRLPI